MGAVKITVIDKIARQDLQRKYGSKDFKDGDDTTCEKFKIGDTFTYSSGEGVPTGFCAWAWADINRDAEALKNGANFAWIKPEGTQIACCTDGLRPVFFKIERIG